MNYLMEINAFHDWLTTNPTVKSNEINLWYALMNINNSCGWKKEFAAAVSTIIDKTRLSKDSIYRSRNKLIQLGRIKVKERPGNQAALYSIVSLLDTQSATQINGVSLTARHSPTQCSTQSATQSATQPATIPKLNYTKLKEIGAGEEFVRQWERWHVFRKEKKEGAHRNHNRIPTEIPVQVSGRGPDRNY
jgi:hypothetical protein